MWINALFITRPKRLLSKRKSLYETMFIPERLFLYASRIAIFRNCKDLLADGKKCYPSSDDSTQSARNITLLHPTPNYIERLRP